MAILLDCALESQVILDTVKVGYRSAQTGDKGSPTLGIITSGTDPASQVYIRNKEKDCQALGFKCVINNLNGSERGQDYIDAVVDMGLNPGIHSIIVQLPLPETVDSHAVLSYIPPYKDVDGLTKATMFEPCTPKGIMGLLKQNDIRLRGANAVVIGRSEIVGKPMAKMLLDANATVTICHSKTVDLEDYTKRADIVISAVGKPKFITGDMIKPGAVVIDVGINRGEDGKLCGDVDFESVNPVAGYITKVPGGVGLLTRAQLMRSVFESWLLS